jgi:hypothetical protein
MGGKAKKGEAHVSAAKAVDTSAEMVFESQDFRQIPPSAQLVLLKISHVGENQSVSLGAAVFEQLTPQSPFVVIAKQELDNLAETPAGSFLSISPNPGATYAVTFVGEMHALSLDKAPLALSLLVNAEGVGSPIENFGGEQVVEGRFCPVRGRALLKA